MTLLDSETETEDSVPHRGSRNAVRFVFDDGDVDEWTPAATDENEEFNSDQGSLKMRDIQNQRFTTIYQPMLMEMHRRTKLTMKSGEVSGRIKFRVSKSELLHLPPTTEVGSEPASAAEFSSSRLLIAASIREAVFRRIDFLHPSRKECDASYVEFIELEKEATLVAPLPHEYHCGGWRCHSNIVGEQNSINDHDCIVECLHPNRPDEEYCQNCQSPKPFLKSEFSFLRIISPVVRKQTKEYLRIIKECDSELERCIAAEQEARERIAAVDSKVENVVESVGTETDDIDTTAEENDLESATTSEKWNNTISNDPGGNDAKIDRIKLTTSSKDSGIPGHNDKDEKNNDNDGTKSNEYSVNEDKYDLLMMDVDLVQTGVWQRINARSLLPMLPERMARAEKRLEDARAELCIVIQSTYELAIPHAQKVVRGFLLRRRMDSIRESIYHERRSSAAVQIQRIMRSKLANKEANHLRRLRNDCMATKIQSSTRRKLAIKERKRRWTIYIQKLQYTAATIIQSLYRCKAAKQLHRRLAEERQRMLEETERARVKSVEKDAATVIQRNCRVCLAKKTCKNRRIELSCLHSRLLMYVERFMVDHCLWSLMRSINTDYIRYERTIINIVEREEKLAKTFVEKVVNMRDVDHSKAWEQYNNNFKNADKRSNQHVPNTNKQSTPTQEMTTTRIKKTAMQPHQPTHETLFVSPKTMLKRVMEENAEKSKPKKNDGREWERLRSKRTTEIIYRSSARPPGTIKTTDPRKTKSQSLRGGAKGADTRDVSTQTDEYSLSFANHVAFPASAMKSDIEEALRDRDNNSIATSSTSPLAREAKRLSSLERVKDRLRGQYLHFDIPDGLDDTVQRFIVAVTLRYRLHEDDPLESKVHGDFAFVSCYHRADHHSVKEYHLECRDHADPLIRKLHGHGLIFIRQLLPLDRMVSMFSSLGLPDEFIALCRSMLVVLGRMTMNGGGVKSCFSRKYLMMKTRELVDATDGISFGVSALSSSSLEEEEEERENEHYLKMVSFLGEWGDVGGNELEMEEDLGLWSSRSDNSRSRSKSIGTREEKSKNGGYAQVGLFDCETGVSAETGDEGVGVANHLQTQRDGDRAVDFGRSNVSAQFLSDMTKARHKSWVVPYTGRILAKNESKNYGQYRHEPLIADRED
ncbi:hypothetical protein ACHAXS_008724 [Conticribra weissflogii]